MAVMAPEVLGNVPEPVAYGQVVGRFVAFLADSPDDPGSAPDEVPLSGKVTLRPRVAITQWPTAVPPRMAVIQRLECPVVDGDLCAPGSVTPGVWLVATNQPYGSPDLVQWVASFAFAGVDAQPADVTFNVPTGAVVDLSVLVPVPPTPGTVVVVSHEDRLAAEQAAADAVTLVAQAPTWWTGTQAQYDALATKDPRTLYLVVP